MGRLGVLTATTGALAGVLWAVVLASGFRHESESEWSDEPLEDEPFEHVLSRTTPSSIDGIAPSFLVAPHEPAQAHEHEHDVKDEEKGGTFNVADAREDAKYLGHTMRKPLRESIAKATLIGQVLLEDDPGKEGRQTADHLYSAEDNHEIEPSKRAVPSVLRDFQKHLARCGIGSEMATLLFEPLESTLVRRPEQGEGAQSLYRENKAMYYALTRKRMIADTLEDWTKHDDDNDGSGVQDLADALAIRYFCSSRKKREFPTRQSIKAIAMEENRDPRQDLADYRGPPLGAEKGLMGNKCPWCSKKIQDVDEEGLFCDPVEMLRPSAALVQHLGEEHPVIQPDRASNLRRQAGQRIAMINEHEEQKTRAEIIGRSEGRLREVLPRGPKRKGHASHVKKIHCEPCGLNFTSRAGAMIEHLKAHDEDDYIFIYKLKAPKKPWQDKQEVRNEYRPEQHLYRNGKHAAGSDTVLWNIVTPASALHNKRGGGTQLRCRKCKRVKRDFVPVRPGEEISKSKISTVRFMRRHEKKCRKKKKRDDNSSDSD